MITGVATKQLRTIPDDRGYLMEILRDDDDLFMEFGQVYVTTCYPGIVKAWHAHEHQHDHICCLRGCAQLALYDDREGSATRGNTDIFVLNVAQNPLLVRVPPLVWHGFTSLNDEMVMLLNIPTRHYEYEQPDELRRPADDPEIGFEW